ncbi:MAG: AzlD domain-containing protein [Acidimicrobiales bacterium]
MTVAVAVAAACGLAFGLKLIGYLVPRRILEQPRVAEASALITVAVLAALVAVQTVADGRHLAVDARLPAVAVAAVLLWRRVPFAVVVVAAGLVAAGLRALGG